jgi:hypothetical protein
MSISRCKEHAEEIPIDSEGKEVEAAAARAHMADRLAILASSLRI